MRQLGHVPSLDGLRGVAILLVLGVHADELIPGGRLGVDLFFVLSGFLITSLLFNQSHDQGEIDLREFYRRRALRLLPALTIVVVAFVSAYRFSHDALVVAALGLGYSLNIAQSVSGDDLNPQGLGHLWSSVRRSSSIFAGRCFSCWRFALILAPARSSMACSRPP